MIWQEWCNHNKIKSHNCWVGDSHTGEHLYHRSPPTVMKVLSSMTGFQTWESKNGKRNSQRTDFEGQRDLIAGLRQDWGKQTLHTWSAHTKQYVNQDPGEGAVTPQETEKDTPVSVGGSPAEAVGGCGSPWGQGHWQQKFQEVLLGVSHPSLPLAPPRSPGRLQCWNASGQTTNREGTQPAPPMSSQAQ